MNSAITAGGAIFAAHIARQHGVSIQALVAANTLTNKHQLRPGQKLTIPSGA